MATPDNHLKILEAHIPDIYRKELVRWRKTSPEVATLLQDILAFSLGGNCPAGASTTTREQWVRQQPTAISALGQLAPSSSGKRARDEESDDAHVSKKTRTSSPTEIPDSDDDEPLYTLHSISVTSPVRKKVNITVFKSSIRLNNPATNAVESNIPLTAFKRAFLLPTRGKTKPHWTVVLLSSDTPAPTGKGAASASSSSATKEGQTQLIFGVDATPPSFSTTDHGASSPSMTTHPKGTTILSHLRTFLSHLPFPTYEPSASVFRSALASPNADGDGVAGVDGFKGAKSGTLWFFSQGLLWDGKPCEFWALSDIVGGSRKGKERIDVDLGGAEGIRTVSATGRTCSVIISRKVPVMKEVEVEGSDGDVETIEEDEAVDTDIGMVDGKEQESIARWVKKYRALFGVPVEQTQGDVAKKLQENADDDSDEDDSDFVADSSSDGGSATGNSSSDDEDDGASEELGSGSDRSDAEEEEEGSEDEQEGEELDPARHPLLRTNFKLSSAAIEMAVGIVQEDMFGSRASARNGRAEESGDEEEDEEDELAMED
ncbi:hypothetical protein C8Q75DRAFT_866437 [Abortiporus biennis]|nr:hypothetical protein C8Q75DRAFT_866437 [Abortiporus biennis]